MIPLNSYKHAMLLGALTGSMPLVEASEAEPEWLLATGWQSKYVTEGRDNLEAGGLRFVQADVAFEQTEVQFWLGQGTQQDYQEVNVGLVQNVQFEQWQGYAGIARLALPKESEYDTELSVGLAYGNHTLWATSIDYVYSTQASGGFVMLMAHLLPLQLNEQLAFFAHGGLGLDFGYASDQHDGLNHAEIGAGLNLMLSESVSAELALGYSHALQDVRLELNRDQRWLALSLHFAF